MKDAGVPTHGGAGPQSPPQAQWPVCLLKLQPTPTQSLLFTQVSLAVWQWYVKPHHWPYWLGEQKLPGPQSESTRQSLSLKQRFGAELDAESRQSQGVFAGQSASLRHSSYEHCEVSGEGKRRQRPVMPAVQSESWTQW